jgi:hypothetical protein
MLVALHKDAAKALESYAAWAASAYASGTFTPVQFLAVALWYSSSRHELTEDDELRVVSEWWGALEKATAKRAAQLGGHGPFRHVYPLDVLTLLELHTTAVKTPYGWCMLCNELDCWLASIGRAELCAHFFCACGLGVQEIETQGKQPAAIAPGASTIEPPEGFELQSEPFFMRYGPGPSGRLVSLRGVLQWLMKTQELPEEQALAVLADGLKPFIFDALYQLHEKVYAKPVPLDHAFGCPTAQSLEEGETRRRNNDEPEWLDSEWIDRLYGSDNASSRSKLVPVEPGFPALQRCIAETGLYYLASSVNQ